MNDTLKLVTDALKRVTGQKNSETLSEKLNKSGIYRNDGTEIKIKDASPVYKEYDLRSDATLREEAKNYAEGIYASKTGNVNAGADKKINDLNVELLEADADKKAKEQNLVGDYLTEVTDLTDRAYKNGMINSSAYNDIIASAEKYYLNNLGILDQEFAIKESGIKREIEIIDEQRKSALMEYDLKKAVEYEKRLSELRREQSENNAKISQYNARLRELEKNYEENKKRTLEEWRRAVSEGKI